MTMTTTYALTEDQLELRDNIRKVARTQFAEMAATAEKAGEAPPELRSWARDLGIYALPGPEEYGGLGADTATFLAVIEELGYVDGGLSGILSTQGGLSTRGLLRYGTAAQRERFLPEIYSGNIYMGIAITEADSGSNIRGIRTTATPCEGGYRLNGTKCFISGAARAEFFMVVARVPGETAGDGISIFIIDRNNPGFSYNRQVDKLGHHSSDTGDFVLDDAFVPSDAILGEVGDGVRIVQDSLTIGRILYTARVVGLAQACYDRAVEYAKVRAPFGVPIADYQVTKFKLAKMATNIETARTMMYRASAMFDAEPESKETEKVACMAKLHAAEICQSAAWESLQIHGAYGYTKDFEIEKLYRDARLYTLSEGTNEVQHVLISKLLGI